MNLFRKIEAGRYAARHGDRAFELRRERAGIRNRSWQLYEVSTPERKLEHGDRLIDSGVNTIAEGEKALKLVLAVDAHLQDLGAAEEGPYTWTLETRLGPLYIKAGAHHIFMRFEDVKRAKVTLGGWGYHFNPHSGKWNMHWHRGTDNAIMLHDFTERMERVATT